MQKPITCLSIAFWAARKKHASWLFFLISPWLLCKRALKSETSSFIFFVTNPDLTIFHYRCAINLLPISKVIFFSPLLFSHSIRHGFYDVVLFLLDQRNIMFYALKKKKKNGKKVKSESQRKDKLSSNQHQRCVDLRSKWICHYYCDDCRIFFNSVLIN